MLAEIAGMSAETWTSLFGVFIRFMGVVFMYYVLFGDESSRD